MTFIFFSKDRPLQLDAALRTWRTHAHEASGASLQVLYRASTSRLSSLYRQLMREHPTVAFFCETDFRRDLLLLLRGHDYIGFVVDDTVFIRDFSLPKIVEALEQNPGALGFSLRLGRNTTQCYSLGRPQKAPSFAEAAGHLKFSWPEAECDFGYPLELSSSLYRGGEIGQLLEAISFKNPNQLEGEMFARIGQFRPSHPFLLCAEQSLAFSIPANRVQETCPNRAGTNPGYSAESLATLFAEGQRIDPAGLEGIVPEACHKEIDLKLARQAAAIPLVSLIIPCYKQAHYLAEAVESVVAQTWTDWEIIIVNDGSPDPTTAVARELIQKHSARRIRLLETPNGGLAMARNRGIAAAFGAYILPLDSDDRIDSAFLEKTVPFLEAHPEIAIAYTDVTHFGAIDRTIQAAEYDFVKLRANNQLNYCSLYRREAWETTGGYNSNMIWGYEDWNFWISCGEMGFYARRIPGALLYYRVKESSMFTDAVEHDAQLRARIALNHPRCYSHKQIQESRDLLTQSPMPLPPNAPKISVIVPAYNRPQRLREALGSIAGQTFRDFEMIVVNDCGIDILPILARLDPALSVTFARHPANLGMSAARNTGFHLARGKYIACLDDDDVFLPNHLETLAGFLEANSAQAAYTDALCVEEQAQNGTYVVLRRHVQYSSDWDDDQILARNFVPTLCFMFERASALAAGDFDETLTTHEDWDFWIRLSRVCRPVHLPVTTCEFRVREDPTSTTSSRRADFLRTAKIIHHKYRRLSEGKEAVRQKQRDFIGEMQRDLRKRRRRAIRRRIAAWGKKLLRQK